MHAATRKLIGPQALLLALLVATGSPCFGMPPPQPNDPGDSPDRAAPDERQHWAEAIEDNSFLVEEAYNQEPGVVQWILTGMYTRPDDVWAFGFTNEWPVPGETHQLSYTVDWQAGAEGDPTGLGDLLINYRYQFLDEDRDAVAFAPRLSIVLPTGDWKDGIGSGTTGWQVNLPLSKRIRESWALHLNVGGTALPHARDRDSAGHTARTDLWGANEGASVIYLASPTFNLLLEAVAYQQDEFDDRGGRAYTSQVLLNPGLRYAVNTTKGQLVLGASVPVGLTPESPDVGAFLYLSWEAPLWNAG